MKKYKRPTITIIVEASAELLLMSGPNAGDIGSPSVDDNAKECSIWDEVKQLNHKEERYEDWN